MVDFNLEQTKLLIISKAKNIREAAKKNET